MADAASDSDRNFFFERSVELSQQRSIAPEWEASPFASLMTLSSGTRGAVGRDLFRDWARFIGLDAHAITEQGQRYVSVEGWKVQVKLSTLWSDGEYHFQQIRDSDFDFLLCLGLSPDDLHAWFIPKEEVMIHVRGRSGQHTGAGALETFWIRTRPGREELWMQQFGNQLSDVRRWLLELRPAT